MSVTKKLADDAGLLASAQSASAARRKVLFIDDDPSAHAAISRRLRGYNFDVVSAYHGMHGYWTALREKPDVIVTDLRMPQGDGEYLVDCLKTNAETAGIPIIVLTGAHDQNIERRLCRLGVARYLTKPVSLEELIDAIAEHVAVVYRSVPFVS